MKYLNKNLFLAILFAFLLGCNEGSGTMNHNDCLDSYSKANSYLNEYHMKGNEKSLRLSLKITESIYGSCPDFKEQLTNLKITLLMLLKDYEKGFKFVSSLDADKFESAYKKNLYLKTFKALTLEERGDTLKRDELLQELVNEIQNYIDNNSSDKNAIADLFYTKIRFKSENEVIEEIEQLQQKDIDNKDFYEALKESIKFVPKI